MIRPGTTYTAAAGPDGRNSHQRGAPTPLASRKVIRAAAGLKGASAVTKR